MTETRARDSHVLLVEDDPVVAEMYRGRLALDGYRVTVASDGEAALRAASACPPDIVILDYRLPKMDGPAVLQALRADQRTRAVRVVVLSAYDEPSIVEEGISLGAVSWLVKSKVTPPELVRRVRSLIA